MMAVLSLSASSVLWKPTMILMKWWEALQTVVVRSPHLSQTGCDVLPLVGGTARGTEAGVF